MGRRMFSPVIVDQDKFIDMPVSARELYFQLGMHADDDGFVSPKKVMRKVQASDDDLKVLLSKEFVKAFESGVIVITDWKVNNLVRKDWYRPTIYQLEKSMLLTDKGNVYQLKGSVNELVNEPVNVGNKVTNQVNIDQNHLEKEGDENERQRKITELSSEIRKRLTPQKPDLPTISMD